MKLLLSCFEWTAQILANELKILWYKPFDNFSTWMYVEWNEKDIRKLNLNSRIANKIFCELGHSNINNFDELFDFTYSINWKKYITKWHKIDVDANVFNSTIDSKKHTQSITNKAILKNLVWEWKQRFSDPNLRPINILIQIIENKCSIFINTSWDSLHNRWYRTQTWDAPLKENLAASLIRLSNWHYKTPLLDPMCGSGTICIEAAMIARNIAPGLTRHFDFESFTDFDKQEFEDMKQELKSKIFKWNYEIVWQDINPQMIKIAKMNAESAKVADTIKFECKDIFKTKQRKWFIVTNPPYGKRLQNYNLDWLYKNLISLYKWNLGCFITSYENADKMVWYDFKIKNLNNNWEAVKIYLKK